MIRPSRLAAGLVHASAAGVVGAGVLTMASHTLGARAYRRLGGASIAALQALTPHLTGASTAIAAVAVVRGRPMLAASAAAVGVGGTALALPRLARRPAGPVEHAGALRIATVNLLFTNTETGAIGDDLLTRDMDVIAFTEYTAEHRAVLHRHELANSYPHRIDREGPRALGVAVWSRLPLDERRSVPTSNNSIDVRIGPPSGSFRLLTVHTPTPFDDLTGWSDDLETIRLAAATCAEPLVLIGDLNATAWHPAVRAILADGYRDSLAEVGRPFAASWPVGSLIPPFAQLDHALVGPGLTVLDATNFPVPGSDHRGVVVTVRPARRAVR